MYLNNPRAFTHIVNDLICIIRWCKEVVYLRLNKCFASLLFCKHLVGEFKHYWHIFSLVCPNRNFISLTQVIATVQSTPQGQKSSWKGHMIQHDPSCLSTSHMTPVQLAKHYGPSVHLWEPVWDHPLSIALMFLTLVIWQTHSTVIIDETEIKNSINKWFHLVNTINDLISFFILSVIVLLSYSLI